MTLTADLKALSDSYLSTLTEKEKETKYFAAEKLPLVIPHGYANIEKKYINWHRNETDQLRADIEYRVKFVFGIIGGHAELDDDGTLYVRYQLPQISQFNNPADGWSRCLHSSGHKAASLEERPTYETDMTAWDSATAIVQQVIDLNTVVTSD